MVRNKRLQNKVSESKLTLPIVSLYAIGIWGLYGLAQEGWWIQFGSFFLSAFLMLVLNNTNALIRIYSRMVSSSFLVLSCTACFLFPFLSEAICQFFFIAVYLILFLTYQDKASAGLTYYGFLCIGLASLCYVHILCYIPFLWLLMLTKLQTLSWRTFLSSLMGAITPYWFAACWLLYKTDFTPLVEHFNPITNIYRPFEFSLLNISQIATISFLFIIAVIGTIHYWQTSYQDKFRIRQLYEIFIWMDSLSFLFFCLQPQHANMLIRLIIINTAPLVAHFIALTQKRITNIIFYLITFVALTLTAYNLWISSSIF